MTVYSGPVFDMAAQQFGVIADHLSIPINERGRLLMPNAPSQSPAQFIATTGPPRCSRVTASSITSR